MTEAEALKRFIPILGRISTPYERATIVMRVNERINDSQRTSLLGVSRSHVAALAWPSDPVQAKQFEDKLNAAADAGDFVSLIRDGKHLQIEELLAWPDCPAISPDSPLTFWLGEPAPSQSPATLAPEDVDEIDFAMVATRKDLIDAFGKFTEMNITWFDNLTGTPKLKAARKFTGQGGRNSAEPLFCPYEVMQWLADPKRKKGKPLSDTTAWRLLKNNFPKVYNQYSIGDPNTD